MMKLKFGVFDTKAEIFGDYFYRPTRMVAMRDFADSINRPLPNGEPSPYGLHPDDYVLWELGEEDMKTGQFTAHDPKVEIGSARIFLEMSDGVAETLKRSA